MHALWAGVGGLGATPDCGATAAAARNRAAELFAVGDAVAADTCLGAALAQVTTQLEALAAEAEALRAYRDARKLQPAVTSSSCILDATTGVSVCLEGAASPPALLDAAASMPRSMLECSSEGEALALLQRVERGELELDSTLVEQGVQHAAQHHWWAAARRGLDVLRTRNVAVTSEVRRVVTVLRDEAGSVLSLMRQTKMDEATINCAVMWAQGEASVQLNVKFAARLDAPVTVLNVDNEQVLINATHVIFSGVGRTKPKRYQVHLELFAPIDAEASSFWFGSVGTVRFRLVKAQAKEWSRLTASAEPVKNHRIWWEGQEQIAQEERKLKREAEDRKRAEEAEARRVQEENERVERVAKELEERQHAREKRVQLLPLLEKVEAAADVLATAAEAVGEGAEVAISQAFDASTAATAALVLAADVQNETTVSSASQLLSAVPDALPFALLAFPPSRLPASLLTPLPPLLLPRAAAAAAAPRHRLELTRFVLATHVFWQVRTLVSTGYTGLTKDALQTTVEQFKQVCTSMLPPEPAPEPEPEPPKPAKKKKTKRKNNKKEKGKKVAAGPE